LRLQTWLQNALMATASHAASGRGLARPIKTVHRRPGSAEDTFERNRAALLQSGVAYHECLLSGTCFQSGGVLKLSDYSRRGPAANNRASFPGLLDQLFHERANRIVGCSDSKKSAPGQRRFERTSSEAGPVVSSHLQRLSRVTPAQNLGPAIAVERITHATHIPQQQEKLKTVNRKLFWRALGFVNRSGWCGKRKDERKDSPMVVDFDFGL